MRPAHHPRGPGAYQRPDSLTPDLIQGEHAPAGYGASDLYVALIPSLLAKQMVIANHYSGTVVQNSYVHLGVFWRTRLLGVLQFGYALNPARVSHIVAGTGNTEYLELNRMWLADALPRNSESRCLSYALRFIRVALPHVRWVQSFADERCGRLGVVYQAANFLYLGWHMTTFLELDGAAYHKLLLTAHKGGSRGRHLRDNADRVIRRSYRQFRYIYFVHPGARRHLKLTVQPYPKPAQLEAG